MDNRISIGYGYTSATASNPNYPTTKQTTTSSSANIGIEQLFNNNIWLNVGGSVIFSANQSTPEFNGYEYQVQSFGLPSNVTGKLGYSFNSSSLGLQVIPYATTGVVLNYSNQTLYNEGFANSYYVLYGGGVRIEYIVIPKMSIYFDQTIGYLNDQGGSNTNLSAMDYNSALGIKYNATNHIQVGLEGSYNQITATGQTIGLDSYSRYPYNNTQNSYTVLASVAYLFDNTADSNLHSYANEYFAKFDNSYSIGYGFASASNSYTGGNLSAINSSLGFINVDVSHLFDNNVWAKLDGQLLTGITQSNLPPGNSNRITPTYVGFPGSFTGNVGYGFVLPNTDVQLIPYFNAGIIGNISSYNVSQNPSLSYILNHDYYIQYGIGGRAEHAVNQYWQLYFDQLFAELNDRSSLGLNSWRSTSTLGTKINLTNNFELGLRGFYDMIRPNNPPATSSSGTYYASQQNTYGGIVSIGVNY